MTVSGLKRPLSADPTDRVLRILIALVVLPGLTAASYLSYTKLFNKAIACSTGGCEVVSNSRWSEIFGFPVTVLGMIAYVLLLIHLLVPGEASKLFGAFVATCGAAFSIFLQYQALVVLEHLCPYCLTSAVCMLLLSGLTIARIVHLPAIPAPPIDPEN